MNRKAFQRKAQRVRRRKLREEEKNRKRCKYLLRRIYRLLKDGSIEVVFEKLRGTAGETDQVNQIWINPAHDILPTIIHECLHVFYHHWSETKVEKMTTKMFAYLSEKQCINLLARMLIAVVRHDTSIFS